MSITFFIYIYALESTVARTSASEACISLAQGGFAHIAHARKSGHIFSNAGNGLSFCLQYWKKKVL